MPNELRSTWPYFYYMLLCSSLSLLDPFSSSIGLCQSIRMRCVMKTGSCRDVKAIAIKRKLFFIFDFNATSFGIIKMLSSLYV